MWPSFDASVRGAIFRARHSKGAVRRSCELTIETYFSAEIVAGLGKEAKRWRTDLKSVAVEQIKIPITALEARAKFVSAEGDQHMVPSVRGVAAIGVACESEEEEPRVRIKLAFPLRGDDAQWFAMRIGDVVAVDLEPIQLSLVGTEPQAALG